MSKKNEDFDPNQSTVKNDNHDAIYDEILEKFGDRVGVNIDYYSPVSEPAEKLELEKGEYIFAKFLETLQHTAKKGNDFDLHYFREVTGSVVSLGGYSATEQVKHLESGQWTRIEYTGSVALKSGNFMKMWRISVIDDDEIVAMLDNKVSQSMK